MRPTRDTQPQTRERHIARIVCSASVRGGPGGAIPFGGEVQGVLKRGGGVAVGEVHELEGNALLVGGNTQIGKYHVDKAGIAGAFGQAVVGKGGGGVSSGCRRVKISWGSLRGSAIDLGHGFDLNWVSERGAGSKRWWARWVGLSSGLVSIRRFVTG